MAGLRPVVDDEQLEILRVLVDRRRSLGEEHTRKVGQLHHLLLELIPVGRRRISPQPRPRRCWPRCGPATLSARPASRVAAELVADLERIYLRKKAADKELIELVKAPAPGCSTCTASVPPAQPGCWSRSVTSPGSPTGATSRPGTAPHPSTPPPATTSATAYPAAGNRQINRVLHIMATVQLRNPTEGRAYYDRKNAAGKTSMESMRCLKRRLSDIVYRTMVNDLAATQATGPGGHRGTSLTPARPAHIPTPALRTSHFPDPPRPA